MWTRGAKVWTSLAWLALAGPGTVPTVARAENAALPADDGHGDDGPDGAGRRMERLADHLQLSPEVRAQIAAIAAANKDDLKKLHTKGMALRAQIEAERLESPPNWKAIGKLLHKAAGYKADAELIEMQAMQKVEALLTPEQRAEIQRLRQAHRGDHGAKRGH